MKYHDKIEAVVRAARALDVAWYASDWPGIAASHGALHDALAALAEIEAEPLYNFDSGSGLWQRE